MSNYATNGFLHYHPPGSKEAASLDKTAIADWKSPLEKQISLSPDDGMRFCEALLDNARTYGYERLLKKVPRTKTVAADGTVTFGDHVNILETWNQLTIDIMQKNAEETFGSKSWTGTENKQIESFSVARGEVSQATNMLNEDGRKAFLLCRASKYLAKHALGLLTKAGCRSIMNMEKQFTWEDDETGETISDGLTVLFLILQHLRPNAMVDIFADIAKIQALNMKSFDYKLPDLLDAMAEKQTVIVQKDATAYPDIHYMKDIFSGLLQSNCKSFNTQMDIIRTKWMTGNPDGETVDSLVARATILYNNLVSEGRWKKEHDEHAQIISLATQVELLKAGKTASGSNPPDDKSTSNKKKFVVEAWRFV